MRGLNMWKAGDTEYGGTVLWDAARIEWLMWAAVIPLLLAFACLESSSPSGEPPSNVGGGSFSLETPLAAVSRTTIRGAAAPLWSE